MMGLLGREEFDDTFSRFDTIHEYDRRRERKPHDGYRASVVW